MHPAFRQARKYSSINNQLRIVCGSHRTMVTGNKILLNDWEDVSNSRVSNWRSENVEF